MTRTPLNRWMTTWASVIWMSVQAWLWVSRPGLWALQIPMEFGSGDSWSGLGYWCYGCISLAERACFSWQRILLHGDLLFNWPKIYNGNKASVPRRISRRTPWPILRIRLSHVWLIEFGLPLVGHIQADVSWIGEHLFSGSPQCTCREPSRSSEDEWRTVITGHILCIIGPIWSIQGHLLNRSDSLGHSEVNYCFANAVKADGTVITVDIGSTLHLVYTEVS